MKPRLRLAGLLVLLGASAIAIAQSPQTSPNPTPTFKAQVEYVEVDALVTDEQGEFVRGLTVDDFQVFEDGKRQTISNFVLVDIPVERALDCVAGYVIVNDVSALMHDKESLAAAADTGRPVILMHAQGDPKTMQQAPRYDHVLLDVFDYLEARVAACQAAGIPKARLLVDPGIGFGKTVGHNLALLAGLSLFHGLGVPVVLGASRKRFIGTLTGIGAAADRVHGSVAAALAAVAQGAQIVRVHDVAATRQALDVWLAAILGTAEGAE